MNNTTEVSVKVCSKCKHDRPITEYYLDNQRPDKLCPQCKPCMKANAKARRERGEERVVQRAWRKMQRSNPNGRYRAGRLIAEARGRGECTLSLDWVADRIAAGICEASGLKFDLEGHGSPPSCLTPSLDRVDPSKGYTPDNVKVVVWIYNRAKGPNTHEDVLNFCRAMIAYNDN